MNIALPQLKKDTTFLERLKRNLKYIRGVYDPSVTFWEEPKTSMAEFYKTGDFQGSILPYKKKDTVVDGDLRLKNDVIMQYEKDKNRYRKLMKVYKQDEKPPEGAMRLKGNQIMQYEADKNRYKILQTFPSYFIGQGKEEEPGIWDITKYTKETVKNFPKSARNLLEFFGAGATMLTPQGIGEELASKITGAPTSWELSQEMFHPLSKEKKTPADIMFPLTKEATERAGTYGTAVGLSRDVFNLATMPAQLLLQLRHPFRFLREDPAGFGMAILMAKGLYKGGMSLATKKMAKSYLDPNTFISYLEDIPAKQLAKLGIEKGKVIEAAKGLKSEHISKYAEDFPKPKGAKAQVKSTLKEAEKLIELREPQKGKPLTEKPSFKAIQEKIVRDKGTQNLTKAELDVLKQEGKFTEEPMGKTTKTAAESEFDILKKKEPTPEELKPTKKTASETLKGDIDFGAGLGQVVNKAIDGIVDLFDITQLGRDTIRKISTRGSFIEQGKLHGERTLRNITEGLSKSELKAMTFFRQGVKDFKALRDAGYKDVIPDMVNPSPKLIEATKKMADVFNRDFQYLSKYYDDILFTERYIPNIWDIPRGEVSQFKNFYKTYNPFTRKRIIPTLEEGLRRGYKLKVDNIQDIYRIYNRYKNEVIANTELANSLFNIRDEAGRPIITRKKTPANHDYKVIEHPVFGRNTPRAFVHPDVHRVLKTIWERTDPGKVAQGYDVLNATLKFANLSFTLFHQGALSESLMGAMGLRAVGKTFIQSYRDALMGKTPKILTKEMKGLTNNAVKHNVRVEPSPDVQLNILEKGLRDIESKAPKGTKWAVKGVRKPFELWNKALWDHMHNSYKVMAFNEYVARQLPKEQKYWQKRFGRKMNAKEIDAAKNEMGEFANYCFGSLNWSKEGIGKLMLGNPKVQRALHRILLSPDWTLSVIKQAASLVRGPYKIGLAEELLKKGRTSEGMRLMAEGQALKGAAGRYWKRMLAYSFLILQGTNLMASKKIHGEPRFTWQNAPGHETHVLVGRGGIGKNIKGEEEIYLRFGKQVSEVTRWFTSPMEQFGAKTGPLARVLIKQVTKHAPGTGWPTEFAREGNDNFWNRLEDVIQSPIPFSLKSYITGEGSRQAFLMYPTSKGMTDYKAIRYYKDALKIKDEEYRKERLDRITMACIENGVEWEKNYKEAQSVLRMQPVYDKRKYLNRFRDELSKIPDVETKVNLLQSYVERGSLKPLQARQLAREQEERQRVLQQLDNKEAESKFIKRIGGDNYQAGLEEKHNISDDYNRIRYSAIMLIRANKFPEAVKMVKEWNADLTNRMTSLATSLGTKPKEIYGSVVHRNHFISIEKLKTLAKSALIIPRTTAFERQTEK